MTARRSILVNLARAGGAGLLLAACAPAPAASTPAPATGTPAPAPTAPAAATGVPVTGAPAAAAAAWTVGADSKATVRVREQLVGRDLPNDAVLVATGATGTFALRSDGTFGSDSRISFDLTTLTSDSRDRDNFVKNDTIQTRQFPRAEIVPLRATGLPATLPASGDLAFKLTGSMTVHGVTREAMFDVVARRNGANLTATATANPSFKFGDFGMRAPSVPFRVVSVTDEIRLTVDLVATGPAA